jgi:transposase
MALSEDIRERVVKAVTEEGMSRNAAARRFGVGIASAVRWVARFHAAAGSARRRWVGTVVPDGSKSIAVICWASTAASRT